VAQTVPSHPEALPALKVLQEHFPDPIPIAEVVAGNGETERDANRVLRGLQDLEHNGLAIETEEGTWAATTAGKDYNL
jgi:hypothetical protein